MDNFVIWNCRGVGNRRFLGLIRDYVKIYKLSFLAILEPRISGVRAEKVIDKLGFDRGARVDAVGFAGGIRCLWRKSKIAIKVLSSSKFCILLKVNPRSSTPWHLAVVYRSPQERHREDLWNELHHIHNNINLPWSVAGDFNSVLHAREKEGGRAFNHRAGQQFAQCIFDCNLVDLGCKGPFFTWRSSTLKERLDRALGNTQWQSLFPNCSIINVPMLSSDHCGVWLKPMGDHDVSNKPYFKFLGPWLEHEDFHVQVQNAWQLGDSWNSNISHLSKSLDQWNRNVFGNLFLKKGASWSVLKALTENFSKVLMSVSPTLNRIYGLNIMRCWTKRRPIGSSRLDLNGLGLGIEIRGISNKNPLSDTEEIKLRLSSMK